jgi:hypothetical protein
MQTVIDTCGPKRCKVTGVYHEREGLYQYVEGLTSVEIDALQWGPVPDVVAP